jgi:hypothetical protein
MNNGTQQYFPTFCILYNKGGGGTIEVYHCAVIKYTCIQKQDRFKFLEYSN